MNALGSAGKTLRKWLAATGNESNDEMKKLMEGKMEWGNLVDPRRRRSTLKSSASKSSGSSTASKRSSASTRKMPKAPHPSPWSSLPSTGSRILSKFETPRIHDPRDLLKHFPIDLLRIRDSDIIAIVWNKELLAKWKNERPSSYNEHLEYEMYTEYRLVHTLRQHKELFEIMAPKRSDEIVRIRFNRPRTPPARLVRREDIYKAFPVIVDKREGKPGEATFGIIIRGDYKRSHTRDEVARMTADLMLSLNTSKYWKVLPAVLEDEICRIEMSHA